MNPVSNDEFFRFIFGELEGHLCLVTINRKLPKNRPGYLQQHFYNYPDDLDDALLFAEKNKAEVDIYFAPFLMTKPVRKKKYIVETPVAWADGDDCPIEAIELQPSAIVRSSTNKYHFYWKFRYVETSDVGENVSRRIAYYHADEGMDKSGWDLTQLLRVPGTFNHKYTPPLEVSKAIVEETAVYDAATDFSDYPELEELLEYAEIDELTIPDEEPEKILNRYKNKLNPTVFELFYNEPETNSWNEPLYKLECTLIEAGLPLEEVFVIAEASACNKYKRDNRPKAHLWKEVQKAGAHVKERSHLPPELDDPNATRPSPPSLLSAEDREEVNKDFTFIERYITWAKTLSDAAPQYHPVGAFVVLSSLLCGSVKLPTQFGVIHPNLWFMILADTTLTRKSTAMENAADLLMDVDDDVLLATDGSLEGLLTAMAGRANKPSLFLRDEITGLVEAMSKKEYMAGMMETLTKLYDGRQMKRILRRETIDVRNPRLTMLSGGIRDKMMELLDYKHVSSGFLPRFVFVTAESDITRIRPMGPPTEESLYERDELTDYLNSLKDKFAVSPSTTNNSSTVTFPKQWNAELTSDAWLLYNQYETTLVEYALASSDQALMTPMMSRLSVSGLKCAVLIAASRMPEDKIVVDELDLKHAFYYVDQWIKHTLYIMQNIGTTQDERRLQRIMQQINATPGIMRSTLMQKNYLSKRDADAIFGTLEERNAIRREHRQSRGERIYPL